MSRLSGADGTRIPVCTLVVFLGVAGLPAIATGGRASSSGALATKLRHGPGISNHPVGVVPSSAVRIPPAWPLAADGTLTCRTCHVKLPSLDRSTPIYLRGSPTDLADSTAFCLNCHKADDGSSMHLTATRFAHIPEDASVSKKGKRNSLDAETMRCLSCHDGVTASESHNSTPWNRMGSFVGDKRRSHPVGVAYTRGGRDKQSALLRPIGLLPDKIRLPEGKVGCVSCHDLYNLDRHRLAEPIEGSALCFACHAMD